jgi:hypothetical protein
MIHRHPTLYRMLSLTFFGIALVFLSLSLSTLCSPPIRLMLFVLSLCSFILTLSYAWLGTQEEHGLF